MPKIAIRLLLLLALAAIGFGATRAYAVIVAGGDGTRNISPPSDDPGWANIGSLNGATGVYVGNRWVLTVAHVGAGTFYLNGTAYAPVDGSAVRLKNADNSDTDLVLFRLQTDPALPALTLSPTAPPTGASLLFIGNGRDRDPNLTSWRVDGSTTPPTWIEGDAAPTNSGYKWLGTQAKRWGTNQLMSVDVVNGGYGNVTTLISDFSDDSSATADECQVAAGDSGGAVFWKNGTNWELSGIIGYQGTLDGQPANTAAFGDTAYAASMATYHDQIISTVDPPLVPLSLAVSPAIFSETAGANAATGTLTRGGATNAALTVSLVNGNPRKIILPGTVTIPANASSVTFPIGAVNNTIPDGLVRTSLTATAEGYSEADTRVLVTDDEARLGLIIRPTTVVENAGANAATGTVARNTPTTGPLVVKLLSGNKHKVSVPLLITIPAGQKSVTFPVAAVDNSVRDGKVRVQITAQSKFYPVFAANVTILDND